MGDFRAIHMPASVVTGSIPALYRVLHRSSIKNHRAWLRFLAVCQANHTAQIVNDGIEDAALDPPLGLLINNRPRWQVLGQIPRGEPLRTIQR
jgi:hypothetical protein